MHHLGTSFQSPGMKIMRRTGLWVEQFTVRREPSFARIAFPSDQVRSEEWRQPISTTSIGAPSCGLGTNMDAAPSNQK
jgi:hypothetical protein